jgi:hypothetical protein
VVFHVTGEHAFRANRRHGAEERIWTYEEEATGGWKKFRSEELHDFYPTTKGYDFKENVEIGGTFDFHVRY